MAHKLFTGTANFIHFGFSRQKLALFELMYSTGNSEICKYVFTWTAAIFWWTESVEKFETDRKTKIQIEIEMNRSVKFWAFIS